MIPVEAVVWAVVEVMVVVVDDVVLVIDLAQ